MKIFKDIGRRKHFCGAIGSLNLGAVCIGLAIGWPGPMFTQLLDDSIDSIHSFIDQSWIESAINVGASLGSVLSIVIVDNFGRKASFGLSAGVLILFWILLAIAGTNRLLIVTSAATAGLAVGMFSVTAVMYVSEICCDAGDRRIIGAGVMLFGYLGVFAINLFGQIFRINFVLNVAVVFPIVFAAAVTSLMTESPFYLFKRGMFLRAKICLKRLRDRQRVLEIDDEYKRMEASFFESSLDATDKSNGARLLLDTLCPANLSPTTLAIVALFGVSQMLGLVAVSGYAQMLIENAYPKLQGKLVTSFVDVISVVFCLLAVQRFGRKPLLTFTIIGSALCCFILALYNLAGQTGCLTNALPAKYEVLSVSVICIYYSIYSLGLTPILPMVTGEIFPSQAKTAAVGICTAAVYLLAFCAQRSYEISIRRTSSCLAFAIFSGLGSIGLPFAVALLLPDTKGKSSTRMESEFDNVVIRF